MSFFLLESLLETFLLPPVLNFFTFPQEVIFFFPLGNYRKISLIWNYLSLNPFSSCSEMLVFVFLRRWKVRSLLNLHSILNFCFEFFLRAQKREYSRGTL